MTYPGSPLGTVSWFVPGLAFFLVASLLAAGPVARAMRDRWFVAWLLLISVGAILSATVTPIDVVGEVPITDRTCDLQRFGLATRDAFRSLNDVSLNILLFMPLGIALGLMRRSGLKVIMVVAALATPILIEVFQLATPSFGRGCELADMIDNLTGLCLGLAVGAGGGIWLERGHRP